MTIKQQLQHHLINKNFCKVKRQVGKDSNETNNGYVLDYSDGFVLFQEADDFIAGTYVVFPIHSIREIIFGNDYKYYNKIMKSEKQLDTIHKKHDIDLANWTTIFKTIKKTGLNVIIENENPEESTFLIGPIVKIIKTAVYIHYFNAQGFLDIEPTKINFELITTIRFDDRYTNIFSKYLRRRKRK